MRQMVCQENVSFFIMGNYGMGIVEQCCDLHSVSAKAGTGGRNIGGLRLGVDGNDLTLFIMGSAYSGSLSILSSSLVIVAVVVVATESTDVGINLGGTGFDIGE